jgi:N-methylhydantoinase B
VRWQARTDFIALTDELENYTEDAVRRAIAEVPDGIYEYGMEVDGISKPVHVQIAITVAGDSLKVDFSGSASQDASQAVNAVFNFTLSETATAVQTVLTPTTPFNEGFLRAV